MTPPQPMPHPETMVTLDHLYHRGDPRRGRHAVGNEKRYVAACRRCNSRRGYLFEIMSGTKKGPKAPLQKRS